MVPPMPDMPRLSPANAAVAELEAWLLGERERGRIELETEEEPRKVAWLQGRLGMLAELLQNLDPGHRRYGERAE